MAAAKKAKKAKKPKRKPRPSANPVGKILGSSLEDLYNKAIVALEDRDAHDRAGVFHPSAVGMCGRASVYLYNHAPTENQFVARDLDIFWIGHRFHERIQEAFAWIADQLSNEHTHVYFESEAGTPDGDALFFEVGIKGTADGVMVVKDLRTGVETRYLIEIKTANKDTFEKVVNAEMATESHELQAHLYAHRFNCENLIYVYLCKDNCKIQFYESAFSAEILAKAVNKFAKLQMHVEAGTLPDREESWFFCKRCEYGAICKPDTLRRSQSAQKKKRHARALKRGFRKK